MRSERREGVEHRSEVRRDDGELCGYVVAADGGWRATTVFGGILGEHADEEDATRQIRDDGLASVAERWTLVDADTGEEQVVCIQQMSPDEVTLALDYYSLPGVPTMTLATAELALEDRWRLERRS